MHNQPRQSLYPLPSLLPLATAAARFPMHAISGTATSHSRRLRLRPQTTDTGQPFVLHHYLTILPCPTHHHSRPPQGRVRSCRYSPLPFHRLVVSCQTSAGGLFHSLRHPYEHLPPPADQRVGAVDLITFLPSDNDGGIARCTLNDAETCHPSDDFALHIFRAPSFVSPVDPYRQKHPHRNLSRSQFWCFRILYRFRLQWFPGGIYNGY